MADEGSSEVQSRQHSAQQDPKRLKEVAVHVAQVVGQVCEAIVPDLVSAMLKNDGGLVGQMAASVNGGGLSAEWGPMPEWAGHL